MRTLIFGIVLIVLIGIGGFFYRSVMENGAEPVACTMDAMVCPDGSSVGRIPPSCEFAACPASGFETAAGVSFTPPAGYVADTTTYADEASVVASFAKPTMSAAVQHRIIVRAYPINEGETADEVILANTRYQPADMQAEDFSRFETAIIDGRTFRSTVIERFEGIVHSAYFYARPTAVISFELIEHDVTGWMEPGLVIENLPEHQNLLQMLGTVTD